MYDLRRGDCVVLHTIRNRLTSLPSNLFLEWNTCTLVSTQECGHNARCLLLPDGEALALDAWGHVAVETGDIRHLSPSTVASVAVVHLQADGPALVKGMLEVTSGNHR